MNNVCRWNFGYSFRDGSLHPWSSILVPGTDTSFNTPTWEAIGLRAGCLLSSSSEPTVFKLPSPVPLTLPSITTILFFLLGWEPKTGEEGGSGLYLSECWQEASAAGVSRMVPKCCLCRGQCPHHQTVSGGKCRSETKLWKSISRSAELFQNYQSIEKFPRDGHCKRDVTAVKYIHCCHLLANIRGQKIPQKHAY